MIVEDHFKQAKKLLDKFVEDERNLRSIEEAGDILAEALSNGNKVYSCGNGGSLCDAMHFAEEMTGNFRDERTPFPAIAIADPAHITCTSNDFGFEQIFSRYIEAFGERGDVLLAISTSGNSRNVLNGVNTAKKKGVKVIGLTGKNGGELSYSADIEIRAPYSDHSDHAQELHIKIIHSLIQYVEQRMDQEG
ncbi:MAG: D-sedoheptulose 7-phosphate isomerase [Flavobacteriales bacterium]